MPLKSINVPADDPVMVSINTGESVIIPKTHKLYKGCFKVSQRDDPVFPMMTSGTSRDDGKRYNVMFWYRVENLGEEGVRMIIESKEEPTLEPVFKSPFQEDDVDYEADNEGSKGAKGSSSNAKSAT